MSLAKYLEKRKMELLFHKIECFMEIQWKIITSWLISESQQEKYLKFDIKKRSAIIIIVGKSKKAAKICSKKLRFGEALKIVKKYWKAKPGLICLSFARINHDYFGEYEDKAIQYVICASINKVEDCCCEVTSYII